MLSHLQRLRNSHKAKWLIMAEAGFCAKSDLLQSLSSFRQGILLSKSHSTPLPGHIKEKEGEREQNSGRVPMNRRPGGAALCWASLEQISRLTDSGGKGSDASVIRHLAWKQGPQRNQQVSGLTKKA